ncbi:UNVERIFIED_CONTAM: hypothetical protein Sindi_2651100 [Sesamum indicum]
MKGGDQCSRVFFRKIPQRRSSKRIFQINDEQGSTHTDPEEVINEFIKYYQNLLGGDRRRARINIRFLRPWARHILSNEESTALLLPFTPADVKQAVFDIAEDKAPGPNGYSSGFFKAAWPKKILSPMDGYSGKTTNNRQTLAHTHWRVYSM